MVVLTNEKLIGEEMDKRIEQKTNHKLHINSVEEKVKLFVLAIGLSRTLLIQLVSRYQEVFVSQSLSQTFIDNY